MNFCSNSLSRVFTLTENERSIFFNGRIIDMKKFKWNVNVLPSICLSGSNLESLERWHHVLFFQTKEDMSLHFFNQAPDLYLSVEEDEENFDSFYVYRNITNILRYIGSLSSSYHFVIVFTSDVSKIVVQPLLDGVYHMVDDDSVQASGAGFPAVTMLDQSQEDDESMLDQTHEDDECVDDHHLSNDDNDFQEDKFNISKYSRRFKEHNLKQRRLSAEHLNCSYDEPQDCRIEIQPLCDLMNFVMLSRDIDSIGVHSKDIGDLIAALSDNSVVKLFRLVGKIPTTSSRIALKIKVGDGFKEVPLHRFPNICLGSVISNNIQFHINFYCLKYSYQRGSYVPFSNKMRFVVATACNLARMLQCNMLYAIKEQITSNSHHFDGQEYQVIQDLIHVRQDGEMSDMLDNSFWIANGQTFYTSEDDANQHVLSATTNEALYFFYDFMLSLQLLSLGVLSIPWFRSNCILSLNNKIAMSSKWSTFSLKSTAQDLYQNRYFGLTAAGTKHSFKKYPPFVTQNNIYSENYRHNQEEEQNLMDYQNWLKSSGEYYTYLLSGIFPSNNQNILMTVDDAINVSPLQFECMLLPTGNNEVCHSLRQFPEDNTDYITVDGNESLSEDDDDDSDYKDEDSVKNDSISSEREGTAEREGNIISLTESEYGLIAGDNDENLNDMSIGENDDVINEANNYTFHLVDDTIRKCEGFPKSKVNRFRSLIPIAEHEHSGHVTCVLNNGLVSFPERRFRQGLAGGGQKYLPITKSLTYADSLKHQEKLSYTNRLTFMIMQGYSHDVEANSKGMEEILEILKLMDFSEVTSQEKLHRSCCVRIEGFRMFHGTDFGEAFETFAFDLQSMSFLAVQRIDTILTYSKTLDTCIGILNNVFGKQSLLEDKSSLSTQAKMLVQFCAEVVSFELGKARYLLQGPITKFLLNKGLFRNGISTEFLRTNNSTHDLVRALTLRDVETIGWQHYGINPSIWTFNVVENVNLSETLAMILPSLAFERNRERVTPRLDMDIIERTRTKLRAKLFLYEKKSIEKDLTSWKILVASTVMAGIKNTRSSANDSSLECAFNVIDSDSIIKCINENPSRFSDILEGIAELFVICYEWEYKSDLIGKGTCPLPRNVGDLEKFGFELEADGSTLRFRHLGTKGGNHGRKTICTIAELEKEMFQQYSTDAFSIKTSSWKSCIYLQLYRFVLNQLFEAKQMLPPQSTYSYLLTKDFFDVKIARVLLKNSSNKYDPPFVWHTTKNDRMKERGTYVGLDQDCLEADIQKSMKRIMDQAQNTAISIWHDSTIKEGWKYILRKEIDSKYTSLYKTLKSIPFPLFSKEGNSGLSFGFLLMVKIVVMILESRHLIPTPETIKNAKIDEVWQVISGIDTSMSRDHASVNAIQQSHIYTIWSKRSVFSNCWKLYRKQISNRDFDRVMSFMNHITFDINVNKSLGIEYSPPYVIDLQFVVEMKFICLLLSSPSCHSRMNAPKNKEKQTRMTFEKIVKDVGSILRGFHNSCTKDSN